MEWNIADDEFIKIADKCISQLINNYNISIVPLEYIYRNLDKELKRAGIFLKLNNKRRSVKVYIKSKYKNWVHFLFEFENKFMINRNNIIII